MTHQLPPLYWTITYWPRCAIALIRYRQLPSNMSLSATLIGLACYRIRPHWLRG